MRQVEWKGVAIYTALVFGIGYLAQGVLLGTGLLSLTEPGILGSAAILALIFLPGLAALVAEQASPLPADLQSRMWPLPAANTFQIILVVPVVYLVANLVLWLIGWTHPDWQVSELVIEATKRSMQPIPESVMPVLPMFLLVGVLALSVVLGATLYAAVAFAFEFGWRGYLFPRLLPLGVVPATLLASVGPFLLALPAVVYVHVTGPDAMDELLGNLVRLFAITLAVGAALCGVWRRTRHLGLVAIVLGSVAAHSEAAWDALFPASYWWWTGSTGLAAAACWAVVAFFPAILVRNSPAKTPPKNAT